MPSLSSYYILTVSRVCHLRARLTACVSTHTPLFAHTLRQVHSNTFRAQELSHSCHPRDQLHVRSKGDCCMCLRERGVHAFQRSTASSVGIFLGQMLELAREAEVDGWSAESCHSAGRHFAVAQQRGHACIRVEARRDRSRSATSSRRRSAAVLRGE